MLKKIQCGNYGHLCVENHLDSHMWKLLCGNSAFLRGSKSPPMNGSPVSMITSLPTFSCSFTILKMWKANSVPSFPQIRIVVCHKKLCDSKFPFHNLVVRVETLAKNKSWNFYLPLSETIWFVASLSYPMSFEVHQTISDRRLKMDGTISESTMTSHIWFLSDGNVCLTLLELCYLFSITQLWTVVPSLNINFWSNFAFIKTELGYVQ